MSEHKVGLLLQTLFLESLDLNSLTGDEVQKIYDCDADSSCVPDPVKQFVTKATETYLKKSATAGVSDFSWDAPLTAAPLEKHFTNPLNFTKGSMGYKLKITRIEEKMIDGEKWNYSYAGDDLVDARAISE